MCQKYNILHFLRSGFSSLFYLHLGPSNCGELSCALQNVQQHCWPLWHMQPQVVTAKNVSTQPHIPLGQNHPWLRPTGLGSTHYDSQSSSYPAVKFYPRYNWSPFSVQVLNWGRVHSALNLGRGLTHCLSWGPSMLSLLT